MSLGRQLGALGAATTGVGAATLATLASACCVGPVIAPLVVAVLGAGGAAWAAGLKPYGPYLLLGSALLLGYGFWSVFRRRAGCGEDSCRPAPRLVRVVLWLAAALWLGAAALNVAVRL